jgi:adenine deaminase
MHIFARMKAQLLDYWKKRIYPAEVIIAEGKIKSIREISPGEIEEAGIILPGFIDAHIHIESSMLVPSEFARLAVIHGTVATISDPHEIANVCGIDGVHYMIENGKQTPFKFHFGAPSCVPATVFETAGEALDSEKVAALLKSPDIYYLSEMMNFPGVLNEDPEVMAKIRSSKSLGKPVDGHAPGLRGELALKYISAGISTDHECFTAEEALDKLNGGMKIIIREGSAAKNFEALIGLAGTHFESMMFCSDDKHPDSLVESHINRLCARAVKKGIDIFKVIQMACINPVFHYKMNVGILREGDPADFILVEDIKNFKVLNTFIDGKKVSEGDKTLLESSPVDVINKFSCSRKKPEDFRMRIKEPGKLMPVIEALDGQLITNRIEAPLREANGFYESDIQNDFLKMAVINRYFDAPVAKSFVKNFGIRKGAIASSVAHDSHNIIVVGTDDESICRAVNMVIDEQGGVSCVMGEEEMVVGLPVGGLMSSRNGFEVAEKYTAIDAMAKRAGSTLSAPFMTLSFMALLVIPHLKLSDKGLFDGDNFRFNPEDIYV